MPKKKDTVEQEPEVTLEDKKRENDALFDQLTNKNREYMMTLNRKLDDAGFPEDNKTLVFNEMLKNIVSQQANHLTARKLYGTATDQARYLTESDHADMTGPVERSESWKIYLDGALLLGGMFAVITGISYLVGNQEAGLGLITMILNFLLGGLAVMVITKYAPQPGVKGGFIKYIVATTITMITWIVLMAFGTAMLPQALNPMIPGSITLVIGVVAFAAKWYLKKKLNIQGTLI
ncbi:DUF1129 domain-containing protein [Alkalibacterium pelagium]|uniref:Uncharacterized membrane-anchored protein n=1 Tax=Alkalibacterium pelagium TaxID=426702 RepID=A0A1H7IL75_9LACT|nr:DUF1129 family protein [Alkalibacterium pelagium]GEN50131.1 hypothetical protein APE02nite_07960 [Alkalibacterium pelagium]SEK63216.1 Uncharacterized membrane-anchored protein [Alkalibacterium pelagium]